MTQGFDKEALLALDKLECLIEGEYLTPYQIVELMSDDMRDWLGNALYAFSANKTALTEMQGLTEEEYYGGLDR